MPIIDPDAPLIVPPGKKTGCLYRTTLAGSVFPRLMDRIVVIPEREWPGLIGEIDLRPHVHHIKDQDGVGSCAWEATALAIEVCRSWAGREWVKLNPLFGYHTTSNGRDQGSNIDSNLEFAVQYGCAPDAIWPRSKGWRAEPSREAKEAAKKYRIIEVFDITSGQEFATALLLGMPVVYGRSGHAITAVSLTSRSTIEYANSWDDSWGDEGFGTDRLSSVNYGYGAWALRAVGE